MDYSLARTNMVKSQVAPNGIGDAPLLEALMETPREVFVTETHQAFAYSDYALPLNADRRCLKPLQIALLIQALQIRNDQKILVAGAGTGYEAALLAHMGAKVFALESDPALVSQGEQHTKKAGIQWKTGEPERGWPEKTPFDAILVCGSVTAIPDPLLNQIGENGVLTAIVGQEDTNKSGGTVMHALRIKGQNGQQAETLFETFAFPLSAKKESQRFVL